MSTRLRCYVPDGFGRGDVVRISPEDARHIVHVLRAGVGDGVVLFDGRGREAEARIESCAGTDVDVRAGAVRDTAPAACRVTLAVALLKADAFDLVVQKATELGAVRIVPMATERTVVRLDPAKAEGRLERWRRIAVGAAAQCDSAWVPEIAAPCAPAAIAAEAARGPGGLVLVGSLEPGAPPLRRILRRAGEGAPARITVLVGPEGDFSPAEYAGLAAAGVVAASFGPRILRAETAALFALGAILYECAEGPAGGGAPP